MIGPLRHELFRLRARRRQRLENSQHVLDVLGSDDPVDAGDGGDLGAVALARAVEGILGKEENGGEDEGEGECLALLPLLSDCIWTWTGRGLSVEQ